MAKKRDVKPCVQENIITQLNISTKSNISQNTSNVNNTTRTKIVKKPLDFTEKMKMLCVS